MRIHLAPFLCLAAWAASARAEEAGFVDDFSRGLCDWSVSDPAGVAVNPGGDPVIAFPHLGPVRVLVVSDAVGEVDDFDVAASFAGSGAHAALPGHGDYGITYGWRGPGTYYLARVFPAFPGGAFRHEKYVDGWGTFVYPGGGDNKHTGATFNAGDDNAVVRPTALRIRKTGTLFELFVATSSASGWSKFFEFTDASCLPGKLGFFSNGAQAGDSVGARFAMFGTGPRGVAEVLASADLPLAATYERGSHGAGLDVNGDGLDDVLVARQPPAGESAFVYLGAPSGLSTTPATRLVSPDGPHFPGLSSIHVGDLDGDGFGDVVFPLHYASGASGRVFLYRGSATGLSPAPALVLEPPAGTIEFGSAVAAGDFDGDGTIDLVVGAPGVIHLYRGAGGSFESAPSASLAAPDGTTSFGRGLGSAGDTNGDGCADLVVFSYPARFYVCLGSAAGLGAPALAYEGSSAYLGPSFAAGDFNRDGLFDFAVNEIQSNRILVWHGRLSGPSATPDAVLESPAGRFFAGRALAGLGDFDGDGTDDIASSDYDGVVDVYLGSASGLSPTPAATWTSPLGPADSTLLRLAGAGDVNRDGRNDLLVGTPVGPGSARIFFGGRTGTMAAADLEIPWPGPNPHHPDSGGFGSCLVGFNPVVRVHRCNENPVADAGPDRAVECAGGAGTAVVLDGSGSSDTDGDTLTYTWTGPFGTANGPSPTVLLSQGTHEIALLVADGRGGTGADAVRVVVEDSLPPVLSDVPADLAVEQTSPAGATVSLVPPTSHDACAGDLAVVSDAPAVFPPGSTTVTWTSADPDGHVATAKTVVTVADTTAPDIASATADPAVLKQNNQKMVDVTVSVEASDAGDAAPSCEIVEVASDEPDGGEPDWEITGALTLRLRAERLGTGGGRTYAVTVRCTDASGNFSDIDVLVVVPHDSGSK